jgi:hypothetical protein
VRISLFDDQGSAVAVETIGPVSDEVWAASEVREQDPPAVRSLASRLENTPTVEEILLGAAVFELRRDGSRWRSSVERAIELDPENP